MIHATGVSVKETAERLLRRLNTSHIFENKINFEYMMDKMIELIESNINKKFNYVIGNHICEIEIVKHGVTGRFISIVLIIKEGEVYA